ncbi:MAG: elongation factor P maturation arginine rhamnosyltransferase EarP, partial [Betaproteobacteria bacterium]
SLFAYPSAPLEALLDSWARCAQVDGRPVRLMLTEVPLQGRAARWLQAHPQLQSAIRLSPLSWLSSQDFDHLLWACELNFVRGEDSLVRALWAGRPFVWQLYPQDDGAHGDKLQAFWDSMIAADAPEDLCTPLLPWWQAWNGLAPWPADQTFPWACSTTWEAACLRSRSRLMRQPALAQTLLHFVAARRGPG